MELNFNKSHIQQKLPVVLTQKEISALLPQIDANYQLICQLMYGSGLRLMEAVRLRVQDIDFDFYTVRVWQGKGGKNRCVTLAHELISALKNQIRVVEKYYLSYFTALICNTFTSKRCRHTNGTGTIRAQ